MSEKIELKCKGCIFGKGKAGSICPIKLIRITENGGCIFGGRTY